jgi:hypothetical protein
MVYPRSTYMASLEKINYSTHIPQFDSSIPTIHLPAEASHPSRPANLESLNHFIYA